MRTPTLRAAIVVALLLVHMPPGGAQGATLPEDCAQDREGVTCAWTVDRSDPLAGDGGFEARVPVFARSLVDITVRAEGEDRGWTLLIVRGDAGGTQVARSEHAAPMDGATFHSESYAHVVFTDPSRPHRLVMSFSHYAVGQASLFGVGPSSVATYDIVYRVREAPSGVAPSRPAATSDDPHVRDGRDDARRAAFDIHAVWFDDARLADGLFEAHMRVASLDTLDIPQAPGGSFAHWEVPFTLPSGAFRLTWFASASETDATEIRCNIRRVGENNAPIAGLPSCSADIANATLRAIVAEGMVGQPGQGTRFEFGMPRVITSAASGETVEDTAPEVLYAFALGGPAVWSGLNPRLDPPRPVAPAWHEDPLAGDNLPDTLQVAGAFVAALTFVGGLIVVRRSRRVTRELLERIDRIERAHENDVRLALIELGRLESELTRRLRDGGLKDAQYQIAAQRIAAVAARLALRSDLGLDDGAPGDAIPIHRSEAP